MRSEDFTKTFVELLIYFVSKVVDIYIGTVLDNAKMGYQRRPEKESIKPAAAGQAEGAFCGRHDGARGGGTGAGPQNEGGLLFPSAAGVDLPGDCRCRAVGWGD